MHKRVECLEIFILILFLVAVYSMFIARCVSMGCSRQCGNGSQHESVAAIYALTTSVPLAASTASGDDGVGRGFLWAYILWDLYVFMLTDIRG